MRITVDTAHDSHEDIRKVIRMLQHLVGDSQEIFTNQPQTQETLASPIANIFGDASAATPATTSEPSQQTAEESSESTEDLFAELFSEEELKKMDTASIKDEEEKTEEAKPKKKYNIELY